ncbi:HIRA-interacting protein 3 isoform X2 [Manis pentadactyla]|uniref:HIRA-interacting protein 3 isoform X2 n=1 Tax=Manis pentadactyla TaxID=143292 RepID=UPI00255C3998|nr:HIRA-interacting protein 3 isoform X2 [Manis pentadactyla]KAI5131938.1 Hira-Interacting Protein 3 [Manis pentadactyla]
MAWEDKMQEFTRSLFRGRPDLSTLTHSIVRRRFLAHVGRDHLETEEKQALKRLVEEELLKMQVDEAGARKERLDLAKRAKRPSTPGSDPKRKRFRFNSESEPSSAASSPDCFGPQAKNGMAADISPAEEKSSKQASEKATEESSDAEQQQQDLTAKTGLEKEVVKESSEEEEEGSARRSKVWKEESSEEEVEKKLELEKESKSRTGKKPVTTSKQALERTSAHRKQAREESEDSEVESAQRTGKKAEGMKGAKVHQENEKESEEETQAKKKQNREEEEDWKPKGHSNGGKKSAWEERSCKQKSRAVRLLGDWRYEEEEKERAAASSRDNSEGDEELPVQRKSKDRTQWMSGKRQVGSSKEGEDSRRGVKLTTKGTGKTAKEGRTNSEATDSEREVSNREAGGRPKRENRSSRKSSKKGRIRSSSSSSTDGSPKPKGRKDGSGRCDEDHPAVMRLKRYIRACGAHRNYKKLLGSCRSHKERLSVLRAELEALGLKGNPSLEKCRALKEQREEAAEVASLDITNIISGSGRLRRRTAWDPSGEAALSGEQYRRTLDSEEEKPHPQPPDWSHMRGIISSDGEST